MRNRNLVTEEHGRTQLYLVLFHLQGPSHNAWSLSLVDRHLLGRRQLSGVTREGNAKRAVSHPHVWTDGTEVGW